MFVLPTAGARASVQGLRGRAGGGAAPPKTLRAAFDREEMSTRQNLAIDEVGAALRLHHRVA